MLLLILCSEGPFKGQLQWNFDPLNKNLVSDRVDIEQPPCKILCLEYKWMRHKNLTKIDDLDVETGNKKFADDYNTS